MRFYYFYFLSILWKFSFFFGRAVWPRWLKHLSIHSMSRTDAGKYHKDHQKHMVKLLWSWGNFGKCYGFLGSEI